KEVKGLENKKVLGMPQNINAESLLSLKPDLVLYGSNNENKKLIEQLGIGKIKIQKIEEKNELTNIVEKIDVIANLMNVSEQAKALKSQVETDLKKLDKVSDINSVKVAFIYARGPSQVFMAGKDTPAHTVI